MTRKHRIALKGCAFQCVKCGYVSAGRMPRKGDTTVRFPRRHTLPDGASCTGNHMDADWVRPADKPTRQPVTVYERMEIVHLRRDCGLSLQAIAKKFNRSASGIGKICIRAMAGRGGPMYFGDRRIWREQRKLAVYTYRHADGHSLTDTANEFFITRQRVFQICQEVEDAGRD